MTPATVTRGRARRYEVRDGERLPDDELFFEGQLASDRAHFVLEQLA